MKLKCQSQYWGKVSHKGEVTGDDLVEMRGPTQEEVWRKLVGRANEERIFINGQPLTALLDIGSRVMHVKS